MATVKKIKKAQSGDRVTVDKKGLYTRLGKYKTDAGDRFYKSTSGDIAGTKDMNDFKAYKKSADSVRSETLTPEEKKHYATARKYKNGGSSPAWQRKEGKNPSGGLNAKGRASYNRANPGKPGLKAPQPQGGPRKKSFCARMSGMKSKLTSSKTANDPNSRINKSLRKWKC